MWYWWIICMCLDSRYTRTNTSLFILNKWMTFSLNLSRIKTDFTKLFIHRSQIFRCSINLYHKWYGLGFGWCSFVGSISRYFCVNPQVKKSAQAIEVFKSVSKKVCKLFAWHMQDASQNTAVIAYKHAEACSCWYTMAYGNRSELCTSPWPEMACRGCFTKYSYLYFCRQLLIISDTAP